MKRLLPLALAASLCACVTVPASPTEALTRAEASFERIQRVAGLVLPYLPVERRLAVEAVLNRIAAGLALARLATTATARDEAVAGVAGDLVLFGRLTEQ